MTTYRTPDVYVKEVSIFPPSVAEVETAIPAFIGYTYKAKEIQKDDLKNVPTEVRSLLDYNELFGGAPDVDLTEVELDENNGVSSYELNSKFYMYDAIRLFFNNGGGKCYIVSIGNYEVTRDLAHFTDGLAALKKKDEPTIILFPDAVLFEGDELYTIQQAALKQCNDLQDRFAVLDLLESKKATPGFNWEDGWKEFRNKIGMNYLKYGAAYTPWLKTNLGIDINYRDVKGKIFRAGIALPLSTLTNDADVVKTIGNLDNAVSDYDIITADIKALRGSAETLKAGYQAAVDDFKLLNNKANFIALFTYIYNILDKVNEWADSPSTLAGNTDPLINDIIDDIRDMITNSMLASATRLVAFDLGATNALGNPPYNTFTGYASIDATEWGTIFTGPQPPLDDSIYTGTTDVLRRAAAEPHISALFTQINSAITEIVKAAASYESTLAEILYESHPVYRNIMLNLGNALTTIPPSGAIAGIYAMVDNARGVWKAPANVSLSSVSGLSENIDFYDQEDLNVDSVAGKSINAIRAFTGKGIMVWGARTLAGNDNEWRYVPVRRFFNMVEESIKKSTYWAVFEPNDANLWAKVKGMIENYLFQKWRDGALAGAIPDDAYFVKIGLGLTMTPQDILEGRLNVEIGMAVVRPAEFIILKFSHKMQQS
jgi:hypothetical protein